MFESDKNESISEIFIGAFAAVVMLGVAGAIGYMYGYEDSRLMNCIGD